MGAQNSHLRRSVEQEFDRLEGNKGFLVLEDVLQINLPRSQWDLDCCHLGLIAALDSDRDGRITKEDLMRFVELAAEKTREFHPYEFQALMHAFCTLEMWRPSKSDATGPKAQGTDGTRALTDWVCRLLLESDRQRRPLEGKAAEQADDCGSLAQSTAGVLLSRSSIASLHQVLRVENTQGQDANEFFNLIQVSAEEKGMLSLQDSALDDSVPLDVVKGFLTTALNAMRSMMADILLP